MKTNDKIEIEDALRRYNNLSDCVIERIDWEHYATMLVFEIDNVRTEDGRIRPDLDRLEIIVLKFSLIQEVHLQNALNSYMCLHPDEFSWGLNEISIAKVVNESDLLRSYVSLPIPFHHVSLLFPGNRQMDIIFSELELLRKNK